MKNIVIAIIGEICSGKSTIAEKIKELDPNCLTISFGDYLKEYCKNNNISYEKNRKILQDIGQSFIQKDADMFLKDVIEHYNPHPRQILLFEGIRHTDIFFSLKKNFENFKSIFIDEPIDIRYKRYILREKDIDRNVVFEDFIKINEHIVEIEIKSLKQYCELILVPSAKPDIQKQISNLLSRY
ncbi:AAA family ATPase [Sediminibacter sp. Hel_I_10]|uniref:AAA family ATPase n=1 Tax=Sediminibacter sp. Hel_I_10 TaxID=1392490 RepID=UPI00047D5265|nr:AAA family ATPase [Sediminibacter sp. Hel_I_10]